MDSWLTMASQKSVTNCLQIRARNHLSVVNCRLQIRVYISVLKSLSVSNARERSLRVGGHRNISRITQTNFDFITVSFHFNNIAIKSLSRK